MKFLAILATLIAGAVYGTWWLAPIVIATALLVAIREYGPDDPEPPMSDLRRRQVDGVANGEYRRVDEFSIDPMYERFERRLIAAQETDETS